MRWNSVGGTAMVEQCWWNSGTVRNGGTVWWNNETVIVEQCGGKVEQCWWNSRTVLVEQWTRDGITAW